jgi:class 3 adenylate cyclase
VFDPAGRLASLEVGSVSGKVTLIENAKRVSALYLFADLRGFTTWVRNNQEDTERLLSILYTLSVDVFGDMRSTALLKRIVKFTGDGFLAVNEYGEDDILSLRKSLLESLSEIIYFKRLLRIALQQSTLHGRGGLSMGFGLTHGTSLRFTLRNFPTDYAGDRVNLAARLCSLAEGGSVVCEIDLKPDLEALEADQKLILQDFDRNPQEVKGFGSIDVLRIRRMSSRYIPEAQARSLASVTARVTEIARALTDKA